MSHTCSDLLDSDSARDDVNLGDFVIEVLGPVVVLPE